MKILLVEGRFYEDISDALAKGAIKKIEEAGYEYERISVPGAFEIPAVINFAQNNYDGFIALGCVIRGDTTHYDYVCSESARGLMQLSIEKNIAIGYGILTVENEEQAWERANVDKQDKGGFAADTCITMIKIKNKFTK